MLIYYSAIVYTALITFLLDITKKTERSKFIRRILFFSVILVLTLIAAFRWRVGTDYKTYEILFNEYKRYKITSLKFLIEEPGIKFISILVGKIKDDPVIMLSICSIITIPLMLNTIEKNANSLFVASLLFIFTGVWHGTFNGVRQYLACSILFYSHKYILSRDFYKYLFMVFLASLFHVSAWIMLFIYFVPQGKLKFNDYFIIILISLILYIFSPRIYNLVDIYFNKFRGDFVVDKVNIVRIAVQFAPLFFYLFFTDRSKLTQKDYLYINILFINAVLYLATSRSIYLSRILIYFSCYLCLGIDSILKIRSKKYKIIFTTLILVLFFIFWYIDISKQSTVIVYKSIFNRNY